MQLGHTQTQTRAHTLTHTHLLYLFANCCHVWYVVELPHKAFQSGLVVPHPLVLHTQLTRMHQLIPAMDYLETQTHTRYYCLTPRHLMMPTQHAHFKQYECLPLSQILDPQT